MIDSLKFHPDKGGSEAEMKRLNGEWDKFVECIHDNYQRTDINETTIKLLDQWVKK